MKNIIIIGASRAGKSTLTKLLSKRIENLMIIRTDLLRLAYREALLKDTSLSITVVLNTPEYIDFVLSYYKYANMYDTSFVKVMDTVDFEPKDVSVFENAIVVCLGFTKAIPEEVVKCWRQYDTDTDWTKSRSDEKLLHHADKEIKNSQYLEEECKKYGIKYVDTSINREEVLEELADDIVEMIKD